MDIARPVREGAQTATAALLRLAGVSLVAAAALFMFVIMLGASMAPEYDMNTAAISDLGVFEETALLFNVTLVIVGVLIIVGGLLLQRVHAKAWITALFVVAGIGAVGAGIFPLDSGGPHGLFALVAFLAFNLQAIAVATLVRGPMRVLSVLAGAVGLVFVVLMAIGDGGNSAAFGAIGHGGTERMIVYPVMVWMLAFGGYLLAPRDGRAGAL